MSGGSYWPEQCKLKCDWLSCYAGLGMVGHGFCFAYGAFWMPCCPEFRDEAEFLREQEDENGLE